MNSVFELLWTDADATGPRILTFTTEPVSATTAKQLVVLIGQYNDFVPDRVCRAIEECPPGCRFEIGREYSPVIYVTVAYDSDQTDVRKEQVVSAFSSAAPDEVPEPEGIEYDGVTRYTLPYRLRFWWD